MADPITWTVTRDYPWDTRVAQTIVDHCVAARDTAPADEEFQSATWEIPAGTVLQSNGYSDSEAKHLLVTAGARSWVLAIDRDGICGCGECAGAPTFSVVEVSR